MLFGSPTYSINLGRLPSTKIWCYDRTTPPCLCTVSAARHVLWSCWRPQFDWLDLACTGVGTEEMRVTEQAQQQQPKPAASGTKRG
jgi:hypothetical protein